MENNAKRPSTAATGSNQDRDCDSPSFYAKLEESVEVIPKQPSAIKIELERSERSEKSFHKDLSSKLDDDFSRALQDSAAQERETERSNAQDLPSNRYRDMMNFLDQIE